jgi:hypothetical protein
MQYNVLYILYNVNRKIKKNGMHLYKKDKKGTCLNFKSSASSLIRCCYITVNFTAAVLQNGVCITHEMCPTMILIHNCSMIND